MKTKKGLISKDKLKIFIIAFVTTATIASAFALRFNNSYEKLKENSTIKIGQLASDDYLNDNANIINQNLHSFDNQGNYIPLHEGVASDIINVCIKDLSLFDVTIYNTYYNISRNRLDDFTQIWNTMKNYMANDDAFSPIYAKISNQSFLEYVLDMLTRKGDIIHFMPEYQKSIEAINEYNQVQSLEKVSKESRGILVKMMGKYEELGKELYKANKNTINDLVKEEKKLGGR